MMLSSAAGDRRAGPTLPGAVDPGAGPPARAGGVSANSGLRARLTAECQKRDYEFFVPPLSLCGDNAAMIGAQAYYEYLAGNFAGADLNAVASKNIE